MGTTTRSTPRTASGTDTAVAPVSAAKSESVSGPREFATKTLCPSAVRRRVSVPPIWPAPMIPIFMFASYGWIAEADVGLKRSGLIPLGNIWAAISTGKDPRSPHMNLKPARVGVSGDGAGNERIEKEASAEPNEDSKYSHFAHSAVFAEVKV